MFHKGSFLREMQKCISFSVHCVRNSLGSMLGNRVYSLACNKFHKDCVFGSGDWGVRSKHLFRLPSQNTLSVPWHMALNLWDFPGGSIGEESICQYRRHKRCRFDPWHGRSLENGMATHSRILTWKIPWTKELGRLESMGSQNQTRLKWPCMHTPHT